MNASLRALLTGLVDYAGLFPPARLPLGEAIGNFAQYQDQDDAWMLGRFICPAPKLKELASFCGELFSPSRQLPLTVLGSGGGSTGEFLHNLDAALQALRILLEAQGDRVQADVFEMRLPPDVVTERQPLAELLGEVTARFQYHGHLAPRCFFETPLLANWQSQIPRTIATLTHFNGGPSCGLLRAGFKLRCGGLEKAAFPSIEQVACCLHQCVSNGVPFKATAGLHHPFRRFDPGVQTTMHGFINVFGGGFMAATHRFGPPQLHEILADDDPSHFPFSDASFRWRDFQVLTQDITQMRAALLTSFGSCSFDEPREDLRALGWL